ncbi:hypothetical protein ALQ64_04445 [Pseudomonas cannabina]|uniref:Uncharacterized protein n=2 Tax=Pseudomonas cannabina TaxID=86840 RepID=A0A3M3L9Y3_PSECA|nr:hypothetical protein PSTA9_05531 [Pseudomonas syringae pv. tomato]RMN31815.1 hypothetical protein ALQ64_04445 [Pseudomonas cannabina]
MSVSYCALVTNFRIHQSPQHRFKLTHRPTLENPGKQHLIGRGRWALAIGTASSGYLLTPTPDSRV